MTMHLRNDASKGATESQDYLRELAASSATHLVMGATANSVDLDVAQTIQENFGPNTERKSPIDSLMDATDYDD